MLLIDYRTCTTHVVFGFLFGVDDSAVGRNINPLQPLLAGVLRIPERRVRLDPEEVCELFFDATERPTRRPIDGQRAFYSGKKKQATIGRYHPAYQAARAGSQAAEAGDRRRVRVIAGQRPCQEAL